MSRYQFYELVSDDPTVLRPIEKAYIDGYAFGDRALEGVQFECRIENDAVVVDVDANHRTYFSGLNQARWLAAAAAYALEADLFAVDPDNSVDRAAVLIDRTKPWTEQTAEFDGEPQIIT